MQPLQVIPLCFVDPARHVPGAGPDAAAWYADAEAGESDRIATRNRAVAEQLRHALPGLSTTAESNAEALDAVLDGDMPPEAVLRRLQRRRVLAGSWRDGSVAITLLDGVAWMEAAVPVGGGIDAAALERDLADLIGRIADGTGFQPLAAGGLVAPDVAAARLMARDAPRLRRAARMAWREAWLARLALPLAGLLGVLAMAASGLVLHEAIRVGTPVALADASRPATFITETVAPTHHALGLLPRFALLGRVGAESVSLPVTRDMVLRAMPGAGFTVLPTRDPAVPWLPQAAVAAAQPVIALGGVGMHGVALLVAPLPLGLWVLIAGWPLWRDRRPAARAAVVRGIALFLGLAAVALGLRIALRP